MSFKPESSSPSLLKNLQHRRVSEILGEHIPTDEAKLLSNGRLTCTVCSRRPIFDTLQILSVHRKGKNHLYELSRYLQHKRTSELKKSKEVQKNFLKTGKIIMPEAEVKGSSLPFVTYTSKYAGSSKKKRYNYMTYERKLILDITEPCSKIKSNISTVSVIEPSANSQVRHYLKSLTTKQPLEKTINQLRSGYCSIGNIHEVINKEKPNKSTHIQIASDLQANLLDRKKAEHEVKLIESGWIKDNSGNWIKDPDAEFDSDEDEAPAYPQEGQ